MLKILTQREKIIFYVTTGVITFAVSFNFLIAPVLTKNDALNKEINITRAKLKKYLWLLDQKDNIESKYSRFSSAFGVDGQQKNMQVGSLSELESLAKEADIRIIDIRPQSGSKGPGLYSQVIVDLRAEGTMEGYFKFIYSIENSFLLLKIKGFQLTAKPNTQLLEGVFSISQFSIPE